MFWDVRSEYFMDSDYSVVETPNESVRFEGKAWKQPNRGGVCDLEKRRRVEKAVIQLDYPEVNRVGRIYLRRVRSAVETRIAPRINLPYRSRLAINEIEQLKRLYDCTDEDICLCLTQIETPLDRFKEVFAKARAMLQLNEGFAQVKGELGAASREAITLKPDEPDK